MEVPVNSTCTSLQSGLSSGVGAWDNLKLLKQTETPKTVNLSGTSNATLSDPRRNSPGIYSYQN